MPHHSDPELRAVLAKLKNLGVLADRSPPLPKVTNDTVALLADAVEYLDSRPRLTAAQKQARTDIFEIMRRLQQVPAKQRDRDRER